MTNLFDFDSIITCTKTTLINTEAESNRSLVVEVIASEDQEMNEPTSHMISVRAIEDIIQIQKLIEDAPNLKTVQLEKEKSNEKVVYSVLKHDIYSSEAANNSLGCFLKECDVEKSFKCNEKNCKRLDLNGWEGDYGLSKYINPDVVVLENFGIFEGGPDPEVKCWSSDSDVTVLRVKKEFRNELSNKVEWEEQRNLADDTSLSSMNLDWESHSLINLAGIVGKEKDVLENLTPFTIWSKTSSRKNSSMHLMENVSSLAPSEPNTPEVKLAVKHSVNLENGGKKKSGLKKKRIRKLFRGVFSCFIKKKSF